MVNALFGCICDGRAVSGLNGNADTRFEHVDHDEAHDECDGRGEFEPQDRLAAKTAEFFEIACACDAHDE